MNNAIFYGFLSGFALLLGSFIGLYLKISKKQIALIMAFGCGVLISSLSVDLMTEAFELSKDTIVVGVAFLLGAIIFVCGDYLIDKIGGEKRKSTKELNNIETENTSGNAILLGTLLDGIPESLVMGAALASGGNGGLVFVVAVFLSNFPEGISGTIAMKNSGMNKNKILFTWSLMVFVTIFFTVFGYKFLGTASNNFKAFSMAFASGAILAMLSDSMLPEAFKEGGKLTGIIVAAGFLVAFLLTNFR
jgi:ZIP family zinc transporter